MGTGRLQRTCVICGACYKQPHACDPIPKASISLRMKEVNLNFKTVHFLLVSKPQSHPFDAQATLLVFSLLSTNPSTLWVPNLK